MSSARIELGNTLPQPFSVADDLCETGNPFIDCLGYRLGRDAFYSIMALYPPEASDIRRASNERRLDFLSSDSQLFVPMPHHFDAYNTIHSLLRKSYTCRNPIDRYHWQSMSQQREALIRTYNLALPRPRLSVALIGCSGLGKSSFVRRLVGLYDPVIEHGDWGGTRINRLQVPFVYIEAIRNCSVKDICRQIFAYIDGLLGTTYDRTYRRSDVEGMLAGIATVAQVHAIGMIVLDELQELAPNKSGGINNSVSCLLRLTNTANNATLMIGTPQANVFLAKELRYIRRTSGLPEWRPMTRTSQDWKIFVSVLWTLQFTRTETPLTHDLEDVLYAASFGIPEFAMYAYSTAQKILIQHSTTGAEERITPDLLAKVASTHLAREIAMMQRAESRVADATLAGDLPSEPVTLNASRKADPITSPSNRHAPKEHRASCGKDAESLPNIARATPHTSATDALRAQQLIKSATEFSGN